MPPQPCTPTPGFLDIRQPENMPQASLCARLVWTGTPDDRDSLRDYNIAISNSRNASTISISKTTVQRIVLVLYT